MTEQDRGLFIVLEGGDGAGKTTQATLLKAWFSAIGLPHVATREPGGTQVGEAIREVVLGRPDLDMPAETELYLILAARAAFVRDVVKPALADGKVVLADRFALSTLAYQGYGRGLDLDRVRDAIDFATGGLTPDLYLVIDVPASEGEARQRRGGEEADRIEQEGASFRAAVRRGYLEMVETMPGVEAIDGRGTAEDVHARIRNRLSARFPATFTAAEATQKGPRG